MLCHFKDLPREIRGAGDDREPLCPGASVPETVGFDEADKSVSKGDACKGDDASVAHTISRINKCLRDAVRRIEMQRLNDVLGHISEVFVQQSEKTNAGNDGKQSLERLQ